MLVLQKFRIKFETKIKKRVFLQRSKKFRKVSSV